MIDYADVEKKLNALKQDEPERLERLYRIRFEGKTQPSELPDAETMIKKMLDWKETNPHYWNRLCSRLEIATAESRALKEASKANSMARAALFLSAISILLSAFLSLMELFR